MVEVQNGFGHETLQVGGASRLCVPSVVLPDGSMIDDVGNDNGQVPPLDHFKCYQARSANFDGRAVFLEDPFFSENVLVKDASSLCTPVDKNGEGILDPDGLLECYRVLASGLPNVEVVVQNQFGSQEMKLRDASGLCVPAIQQEE